MNKCTMGWVMIALAAAWSIGCGDDGGGSGGGATGPGAGGGAASTGASDASSTTDSASTTVGAGGGGGAVPTCESGLEQDTLECQACQDASCCITATLAADDPGTWTSSAATICREARCFEECGIEEPECGGIVPSPASCVDELYANCCAETEACAKNDACVALIYVCIDDRGCNPGSECWEACATELGLEGGRPEWDAFLECFNGPWSCD